MTYLFLALIGLLAAPLPAQVKKAWVAPRTPDGHPDLQGIWTNATITTLERPPEFAGKATVSDTEARAYERQDAQTNDADTPGSPIWAKAGSAGVGFYNNLFVDRGSELARVDGVKRPSLIVDPPDGKNSGSHGPCAPSPGRASRNGRRLRRCKAASLVRAMPHWVRLYVGPTHAAGALQQ